MLSYFLDIFVIHIQWLMPTIVLRFCVRLLVRYTGFQMRRGDVVIKQIACDRDTRALAPVTTEVEKANEQHYGNDPAFFEAHLGPRLKYSACEFSEGVTSLAEAETVTLKRYQTLAGLEKLAPGSRVLELGCGWGSLSLDNAERYPHLKFISFSNSPKQIAFIRAMASKRLLSNITLFVEDYADFVAPVRSAVAPEDAAPFDCALAIETIEHSQNIGELLNAVAQRLRPGALLFVHSLLHQSASYLMSNGTWMGRNFFSGGSIISLNSYFHLTPASLHVQRIIPVNGIGYSKTLLAWLSRLEAERSQIVAKEGRMFFEKFRAFYIVCAEAFAANNGCEFMCGYYVFCKQ